MNKPNYHFIGIGGAGMSVLAEMFLDKGYSVTGSDRVHSAAVKRLEALGAICWEGSAPERIPDFSTVVYSSAIKNDDPELVLAHSNGWQLLHRSEALVELSKHKKMVAVAGAHGKTTTSAMLATALDIAGANPSFAIGSVLPYFGTGGRYTSASLMVAEADESDGSFMNYHPQVAVITNIEPDHLDNYGNEDVFDVAFFVFCARVVNGGAVIINTDDPGCRRLLAIIKATRSDEFTWPSLDFQKRVKGGQQSFVEKNLRVKPTGLASDVRVIGFGEKPAPSGVDEYYRLRIGSLQTDDCGGLHNLAYLEDRAGNSIAIDLSVPGRHNLHNACSAVLAAKTCGILNDDFLLGLRQFSGAARRFELRGEVAGIKVIDDYAHHPTELKALLEQVHEIAGEGHIRVVFEPHLFSRTKVFAKQFAAALDLADQAVVSAVYPAREVDDGTVTSEIITKQMENGRYIADRFEAGRHIAKSARPGDILLTVGAGTITEVPTVILHQLSELWG